MPSGLVTPWPANNTVPLLYFPPAGPLPAPAIVVLHGYGLSKDTLAPIGPHLKRAGYAGLIFDLPFHGERTVAGRARVFPFDPHLDFYVACVRQMVADSVACLAWLRGRPEVDPSRQGVIGFSLGGVLTSLLMGLGLGIRAGVSLMAAGDWADLLFLTELASDARDSLEGTGVTVDLARRAFRDVTASTYAAAVQDLLIIAGRRDRHVPPRIIHSFWERIDHATNRLTWKDSEHLPPVRSTAREVLTFLGEKLRPRTQGRGVLTHRHGQAPGLHGGGLGFPLSPLP